MRRFLLLVLLLLAFASAAHAQNTAITLTIEAGFDGHFRDSEWMPVIIHAANDGDAVSGRLVVRPETSGSGITNTYSTPITLPAGARQTADLYITARSFTTQIRVELINDAGVVIAQQSADVRAVQPQDRLNVVISSSPAGTVDLTGVHASIYNAYQTNWTVADLPDRALDSIDLMLFCDVDSGTLSSTQQQAIADWVAGGGHLVITGGQNWQATAAGLSALLPLTPDASRAETGLQPIADWLHLNTPLSADTVIATGTLDPQARVLVADASDTPLIARRTLGAGVVDYLAADPNNAPLRGWDGLPELWFTLITDGAPQPAWGNGFTDWESAARSAEILPGYDPLPDILPLCGFLALYIALVGPLNYLILNRINRREWAWFTIPAMILIFSVLAYALGFNLRGNEATLNRLTVVQSWPDADRARVEELVGLLSPRRSQYSLNAESSDTLRPIPRPLQTAGLLSRNTQASIDIRETDHFEATDFNVDASFIAGFDLNATLDKPNISGLAAIAYDSAVDGQQIVRGSVRNDSDLTLTDPVILARGVAYQLDQPLAPGSVQTFDLTLAGTQLPAPILRAPLPSRSLYLYSGSSINTKQSVVDILTPDNFSSALSRLPLNDSAAAQVNHRKQYFLSAFMDDYSGSTAGRGDRVYLAGWTTSAPLAVDLTGSA